MEVIQVAQTVITRFTDDLDGSQASGSVEFGLDGREYTIDLSDENAARLRDALAPYIAAARRVGRARGRTAATSSPANQRRNLAEARGWLRNHGYRQPADPAAALQNLVWRLRQALRAAGCEGAARPLTRAPGYLLEVEGEQVDLVRFERLVRAATGAARTRGRPARGRPVAVARTRLRRVRQRRHRPGRGHPARAASAHRLLRLG